MPSQEQKEATFTVEFTIHSGFNLPVADITTLSCDAYVHAIITAPALKEHPLTWRTPTVRRTRDPVWDCKWRVSGIPQSGVLLILKAMDEDPGDRDDRLGKGLLDLTGGQMQEGFKISMQEIPIQKRKGSIVPYVTTYLTAIIPGQKLRLHPRIVVSAKVLGKSSDQHANRLYTVGPNKFSQHFSPLIGHMVGSSAVENGEHKPNGLSITTFQANKLQLTGPVPSNLQFRFVGYRPFINWFFMKSGIYGRILNMGLRKQYRILYSYDKQTVYGVVDHSDEPVSAGQRLAVSHAMALTFLRMTNFAEGARMFTYIITLDAEWRFCETGEEFAIDLLSKHSVHADLAKVIAFSGEFFVRQRSLKDPPEGNEHPKSYELVIDNSSGTYRPKKEALPVLREWLARDEMLGGLGDVVVMDAFDETLKRWKQERREEKRSAKNGHVNMKLPDADSIQR